MLLAADPPVRSFRHKRIAILETVEGKEQVTEYTWAKIYSTERRALFDISLVTLGAVRCCLLAGSRTRDLAHSSKDL